MSTKPRLTKLKKDKIVIRCPLCGIRCADADTLSIHRRFCTGGRQP